MSVQLYLPQQVFIDDNFQTGVGVLVKDGMITEMGSAEALSAAHAEATRVDWPDLILLPGTINLHTHSFQTLLRGIAADQPFLQWRDRALYRYTPFLDEAAIYVGALLAFGEMLRCGITTVCDFFYVHGDGLDRDRAVIRAAQQLGLRLVFARTLYDWEGAPAAYRESVSEAVERTRTLAADYADDPLVTVLPAPHSLHGASPEMIQAGHALAQELGTPYTIHLAEEPFEVDQVQQQYGTRPAAFLDRLGVVDEKMIAVHAVWLSEEEIAMLGHHQSSLAYCPSSNMFLADGVTPLVELLQAGVTVGLGTDGACSNMRQSIFEEMRMAALLQKVHRLQATAIDAQTAFAMGTTGGAAALGLPAGRIAVGQVADFVAVNGSDLSLLHPEPAPLLPNLVYAMQPSAVREVVVGGQPVVHEGHLVRLAEPEIASQVRQITAAWPRSSL